MAPTTRRVTYRGSPALAPMLAQMLEQEGVKVTWERPREQPGPGEMAKEVSVQMVAVGNLVAIQVAVHKFRKHTRNGPGVAIEDDDADDTDAAST